MISSLDDAMPFFNKWKDEQTVLDVSFSVGTTVVLARATVSPNSDASRLELFNPEAGFVLRFLLIDRFFEYIEPREGSGGVAAEPEGLGLVGCWSIKSGRENLILCEKKDMISA